MVVTLSNEKNAGCMSVRRSVCLRRMEFSAEASQISAHWFLRNRMLYSALPSLWCCTCTLVQICLHVMHAQVLSCSYLKAKIGICQGAAHKAQEGQCSVRAAAPSQIFQMA